MAAQYSIPRIGLIVGLFFSINIVFHKLTMNAVKGRPQSFVTFYMGSIAMRMAICLIIIIVYRLADKSTVVPFTLAFMIHYLFFTVFEVGSVLKMLKPKS